MDLNSFRLWAAASSSRCFDSLSIFRFASSTLQQTWTSTPSVCGQPLPRLAASIPCLSFGLLLQLFNGHGPQLLPFVGSRFLVSLLRFLVFLSVCFLHQKALDHVHGLLRFGPCLCVLIDLVFKPWPRKKALLSLPHHDALRHNLLDEGLHANRLAKPPQGNLVHRKQLLLSGVASSLGHGLVDAIVLLPSPQKQLHTCLLRHDPLCACSVGQPLQLRDREAFELLHLVHHNLSHLPLPDALLRTNIGFVGQESLDHVLFFPSLKALALDEFLEVIHWHRL